MLIFSTHRSHGSVVDIFFFGDHALEWWTSKKMQESKVVASLTWVGFKELLVERFMFEYQILHMVINLVQLKYTGHLKAYMHDLHDG